jgi:hypothetical protein
MSTRLLSGGHAGAGAEPAAAAAVPGALVLVAAAAGLVWAVAGPRSDEDARHGLELESTPDRAGRPSQA